MMKLLDGSAPYELMCLAIVIVLAVLTPALGNSTFARIEGRLRRVSPGAAIVTTMMLALVVRAVLLPVLSLPQAHGGDQASLLLQAETFLHGRLANPLHPLHEFFESVYVNQDPAYGSMYFPGRGLSLTAGLALFGSPGAGVWLAMIVLSGVLVWMLQGFVGPGASLVGGVIFVFHFALFSFWINSLFAADVPAMGGALVVGAYARLMRAVRWRDAALLGVGLVLLLLARPFEGFLFSLPIAAVLAAQAVGLIRSASWRELVRLVALPAGLVAAGVAVLLAYDTANTGKALLTPYSVSRTAYAGTPAFLFEAATPPERRIAEPVRGFYALEGEGFAHYRSPAGLATGVFAKLRNYVGFYLWPLLVVPFVAGLGWCWRRQRVLLASLTTMTAGLLLSQFNWSHYFAPGLGVVLLVVVAGLQRLRGWTIAGRVSGQFLSRALPLAVVAVAAVPAASLTLGWPRLANTVYVACCFLHSGDDRDEVERLLDGIPGPDLVFVRYRPSDSRFEQWVYNSADIDAQSIVWAHDLGEVADRRLIAYYPGRRVWLVDGLSPWRVRALDGSTLVFAKNPGARAPAP